LLDDLKYIHERDAQDALGVVEKQWQQLTHEFHVAFKPKAEIRNIVLGGMGGSAWPALYVQSWPGVKVPFEISRTYAVPGYVNEHTLFIASSYSGNTEETLSALEDAESRGAQIVVMTAGGQLAEEAKTKNLPLFRIPGGTQPRMSSFYFIAAYLELLVPLRLVDATSLEERKQVSKWLKDQTGSWGPTVPSKDNPAKKLALEIMGKTPIIYSGPLLAPVANKMKICMNENAKNLAWWGQYPEFNHNEFIGWSSHPVDKPFVVIEIRSDLESKRMQKRFKVSQRMLSGKRPAPHVIKPEGDTLPKQIFWASMFGDFVSVYLALLNGINPTPVDLVEKFKKALDE
jgi:glucose/mannose-6-phosphate isomerase